MVGREMVRGAELRSVIAQQTELNAAVNTFKDTYDGLPGDLSNAPSFGWPLPEQGYGVRAGDGILQSSNGTTNNSSTNVPGQETTHFGYQLSAAGLIKQRILQPPIAQLVGPGLPAQPASWLRDYLLTVNNSASNLFWLPWSDSRSNYYSLLEVPVVQYVYGPDPSALDSLGLPFTPKEAQSIDLKFDDGSPHTGNIRALSYNYFHINFISPIGWGCAASAAAYVVSDTKSCGLQIKIQ